MGNVLIVAYLLIVLALVTIILLQRSEGGGLGMGGGGNAFMSARGSANMLTRVTGILAALFFALAIGLTLINSGDRATQSILDRAAESTGMQVKTDAQGKPVTPSVLDALNAAQAQQDGTPVPAPVDTTPAPAAPAPAATVPADKPDLALPANDNAPAAAAPATTSPATTSPAPAAGDGAGSGTPSAPAQPASN